MDVDLLRSIGQKRKCGGHVRLRVRKKAVRGEAGKRREERRGVLELGVGGRADVSGVSSFRCLERERG